MINLSSRERKASKAAREELQCGLSTALARLILLSAILLWLPDIASALESVPPEVTINEIAWMGSDDSNQKEWIELYNNTENAITLDDWILQTPDSKIKVKLQGKILGNAFYLLERTNDSAVAQVQADQTYAGSLNNKGADLYLYNKYNILIDSALAGNSWPAGNNTAKQTMEKIDPRLSGIITANWRSSRNPGGTPKAANSVFGGPPAPPADNQAKQSSAPDIQTKPDYRGKLVINEIMPSPEGPDKQNEWIEILNKSSLMIDLAGWKIRDAVGSARSYTLPAGTKILPQGFLTLRRPATGIILNNEGDILKLIGSDGQIIDEAAYLKAAQDQSYNRLDNNNWQWSSTPTPGFANVVPLQKEDAIADTDLSPNEKKSSREEQITGNQPIFQGSSGNYINSRLLSASFISLAAATGSAWTILALKKKMKNKTR